MASGAEFLSIQGIRKQDPKSWHAQWWHPSTGAIADPAAHMSIFVYTGIAHGNLDRL